MIRFRVFLGTALAFGAIVTTFVHAQLTDEEKKKQDARKAREEMRAVISPTPSETPEPKAKPKPAKRKPKAKKSPTPKPKAKAKPKATETPEPTKTPRAKKEAAADSDESPTPKPKAKSTDKKTSDEDVTPKPKRKEKGETPEPTKTPSARKNVKPEPDESPTPKKKSESGKKKLSEESSPTPKSKRIEKAEPVKTPTPKSTAAESLRTPIPEPPAVAVPRPAPRPTPKPPAPQTSLPSDITVEKSGLEKEQGFEPPPPPPPRRGFWPWSRQPTNYRYLTSANIDAIRRAPVQRARWKFVIVHNSGTRQGSARVFDYYHRHVRRMKNGLAYHFVIGNGTSTRNGQIEIGERWIRQISGGHVHSDYMNSIGLGICLVGDFNRDQPTRAQLEACEELIKYLQERCGKMAVRPHREVNPPRWATDCPGDVFPYGWFGRFR
ncbi:MAG: hypothetical protein DLM73_15535 [Chthoniobacterales bacterium]|nr:MAG: hypothetical protein DLM73_15535 [Chthoniobacterales bacterium]